MPFYRFSKMTSKMKYDISLLPLIAWGQLLRSLVLSQKHLIQIRPKMGHKAWSQQGCNSFGNTQNIPTVYALQAQVGGRDLPHYKSYVILVIFLIIGALEKLKIFFIGGVLLKQMSVRLLIFTFIFCLVHSFGKLNDTFGLS